MLIGPPFYNEGERSDPRKHGTLSVTLPFLHDLYRPRVEAQRSAGHIGARSLWSEIVNWGTFQWIERGLYI